MVERENSVRVLTHTGYDLGADIPHAPSGPGRVRRDIRVNLPHPRNFDTAEVAQVMAQVRHEIDEEVNAHNGRTASTEGASYEI